MTPVAIIETAGREGVMLSLSDVGTIKVVGDGAAVSRWLPTIRECKAEIIGVLKTGGEVQILPRLLPLAANEVATVRGWLAYIGENDPDTVAEVIASCQKDLEARRYFIAQAASAQAKVGHATDDRRTCEQCANLFDRRCQAAKRGEIFASRRYEPIRDLLRRCEGYAPGADDSDPRPGRERWPNL